MRGRLEDVQGDMVVFGSDGDKVGTVGGIGYTESGETSPSHPSPGLRGPRYLKVLRGFASDLFVPEDAIASIEMGQGVVLFATADEAAQRFVGKPADML